MDKEYKKRWIEALRSGDYEQGQAWLCKNGTYCCLGVLAAIDDQLGPEIDKSRHFDGAEITVRGLVSHSYLYPDDTYYDFKTLPEPLKKKYGLMPYEIKSEKHGGISYRAPTVKLISMNDGGSSFDEIADWIEENL